MKDHCFVIILDEDKILEVKKIPIKQAEELGCLKFSTREKAQEELLKTKLGNFF